MELSVVVTYASIPVVLVAASVGLAHAYNRLRAVYQRSERDRNGLLEVLEGSNDALFVLNFVNGRIHRANQQAAELLGYSQAELTTKRIFDIVPSQYLQLSATRIADAWEQEGLIHSDIPLLTADGRVIPVESSTRVTSYDGRPAVILFARDITERLALEAQLAEKNALVQQQNADLLGSIRYAQRIQRAVLPELDELQAFFPGSFILFRPRDIVSGDMHWFAERDGRVLVVAGDCTGHGVPGALLTLIGASIFQELVHEQGITAPGALLDQARAAMANTLGGNDDEQRSLDGMNAAVLSIDRAALKLSYAGAFAPLWLLRDGRIIEYKGDRMPIGHMDQGERPFQQDEIDLLPGDRLFICSDGLQDQFGGPQGKRLRSQGLRTWLEETSAFPIDDQGQAISDRFRMWKGREEQVDDVLLIGIEIAGPDQSFMA
jgi:PAS domain S-box-containing protein